jgi:hypothetical protein
MGRKQDWIVAVDTLLALVGFGFSLWLSFYNPKWALYVLASLLPANGLFIDIGISLSAAKVLSIALLVWAILQMPRVRLVGPDGGAFVAFVAYALAITLMVGTYLWLTGEHHGEIRVQWRWAIQAISLILVVLPYYLVIHLLKTEQDIRAGYDAMIAGVASLCLLGMVQWLLREYFDIRILGIAREGLTGAELSEAFFLIGDEQINRINSLAREPKDLATAIALVLPIVLLRYGWRLALAIGTLLLITLVLTYSTTGMIVLMMALVVFSPDLLRSAGLDGTRLTLGRFSAAIFGIAAATLLAVPIMTSELGAEILQARLIDRLGVLEDYDELTLDFLFNEPHWLISGVGAGMLPRFANAYLPVDPLLLSYMDNLSWDAKAGILKWLASFGLLGTAFVMIGAILVFGHLRAGTGGKSSGEIMSSKTVSMIVLFVTLVQLVRATDEIFWFVLGLAAAQTLLRAPGSARSMATTRLAHASSMQR